jgi:hypothetical protein
MLALQALRWGTKRISRKLSYSRNTVREYLRRGRWTMSTSWGPLSPHLKVGRHWSLVRSCQAPSRSFRSLPGGAFP